MNIDTIMNPAPRASKEQVNAAITTVMAIAEAIRELGEVPSGHL